MATKLFVRFVESMSQMNEIVEGGRSPSREFVVDALHVKGIRKKNGFNTS